MRVLWFLDSLYRGDRLYVSDVLNYYDFRTIFGAVVKKAEIVVESTDNLTPPFRLDVLVSELVSEPL